MPFPDDDFRKWYHQPARRLSEAELRIANAVAQQSPGDQLKVV